MLLEGLKAKTAAAPDGGDGPELADLARQIGEATEWVNNVKGTIADLIAATGKHVDGLKGGQRGLDGALAALKGLEEGFDRQLRTFDGVRRSLDGVVKRLDERSSALGAVKQELAGYYDKWTGAAAVFHGDVTALSGRLGEGEDIVSRIRQELKSWTGEASRVMEANATAQRGAGEEVSGHADRLTEAGAAFIEKFRVLRSDILGGA